MFAPVRALLTAASVTIALAGCASATVAFDPPTSAASTAPTRAGTAPAPATTSAAPTSAPTTTTPDPRSALLADFDATLRAYNDCLEAPEHCDVGRIAAPGSSSMQHLTNWFARLARNGIKGRPSPEDYRVILATAIAPDRRTATIETCIVDAAVLYDPRGNDDPSDDVILNDALESDHTHWSLALAGGHWRRTDAKILDEAHGRNQCPPRPAS